MRTMVSRANSPMPISISAAGCRPGTRRSQLGETVLDLGSGAGNDVFIARHEVGPRGG